MYKFILALICATISVTGVCADELQFIKDHYDKDVYEHLLNYKHLKKMEKNSWYWYRMGYLEAMLHPEEGKAFLDKLAQQNP